MIAPLHPVPPIGRRRRASRHPRGDILPTKPNGEPHEARRHAPTHRVLTRRASPACVAMHRHGLLRVVGRRPTVHCSLAGPRTRAASETSRGVDRRSRGVGRPSRGAVRRSRAAGRPSPGAVVVPAKVPLATRGAPLALGRASGGRRARGQPQERRAGELRRLGARPILVCQRPDTPARPSARARRHVPSGRRPRGARRRGRGGRRVRPRTSRVIVLPRARRHSAAARGPPTVPGAPRATSAPDAGEAGQPTATGGPLDRPPRGGTKECRRGPSTAVRESGRGGSIRPLLPPCPTT